MTEKMTCAGVSVNYDAMDPFKRMAQLAGRETTGDTYPWHRHPLRGEYHGAWVA